VTATEASRAPHADHTVGRRLAIAAVVTLVVVGIVVATGSDQSPEPVAGPRALVIGDSLLNNARSQVESELRSDGWDPTVAAFPGSNILIWQERLQPLAERTRPNVAVVELGTNDCFRGKCPDLGPLIDRIVDDLAETADAILWLDVQAATPHLVPADSVNAQIRLAAARHPDVRMVEFGELFDQHPEWHIADGLHLNEAGQQALADLITTELRPYRPQ
jgi:lysophospholipase L1-like esterase